MGEQSGSSTGANESRRTFLKVGAGVVGGLVVGGAAVLLANPSKTTTETQTSTSTENITETSTQQVTSTLPGSTTTVTSTLPGQTVSVTSTTTATATPSTVTSTVTATQTSTSTSAAMCSPQIPQGFLTLSTLEATVAEAAVETIIPSDSTGPGAKEAGVIYFIDRQLQGEYGRNGNMYMKGPFVSPNLTGSITVDNITYTGGTIAGNLGAGYGYQYPVDFKTFWNIGLNALNTYAQSAYGGAFATLTAAQRAAALTDLFNNKPTTFSNITPADFAWELFFMTWCGFLMDPLYGGNQGMVGWEYVAFTGVNNGNFYGEGLTMQQLMVASTPTKLKPVSLAQFQAAAGYLPNAGGG
jgi:gluconate 2-dehydrogenase gamma chain